MAVLNAARNAYAEPEAASRRARSALPQCQKGLLRSNMGESSPDAKGKEHILECTGKTVHRGVSVN